MLRDTKVNDYKQLMKIIEDASNMLYQANVHYANCYKNNQFANWKTLAMKVFDL